MLDLTRLEALVDEALENETASSLNEWLMAQRNDNLNSYLGCGEIERYDSTAPVAFKLKECIFRYVDNNTNNIPTEGLAIAA